jgi:phytol kinase
MKEHVDAVMIFFADNFPSWHTLLIGGPPSLAWAYLCLHLAGRLKRDRGWRTGYTRKVFHFLIFTSVALIQWRWGTAAVCLFGGATTLVIFYAVWRGAGHVLYEAMAREKDAPRRTYYIVAPYLATLAGGLAGNILFGPFALFGYLVTGLGDAIGEPVGTRFGRHTYAVPSIGGVPARRSLEGSAAVFAASVVAIALGMALWPGVTWSASHLILVPLLAGACMLLEAVSPHGWDNAVMQVVPSFLALLVFGGSVS